MRAMKSLLSSAGLALVAGATGFAGVYGFSNAGSFAIPGWAVSTGECNIKGNISIGSGARIYHVPGQRYYRETIIRPEYGERWFCSEGEARAAGWRRSKV